MAFGCEVSGVNGRATPKTIDEYIATFPPDVQAILEKICRNLITDGLFKFNGALVYFAAFKKHIGFYPPIRGDAKLMKAVSPYAGEKGNLRFPLSQPIPYDLIQRITKLRVKQNLATPRRKARRE